MSSSKLLYSIILFFLKLVDMQIERS